ncbi:MAG TPA: hypothetical protein VFP30_03245 [Candidatus Limnocylindria bacterium]|nr:hypothetical protein [Candidatus Limnocylindria bacterium]
MAIHTPIRATALPAEDPIHVARLERDLEEAVALLQRLLASEDRIGLVFPVMDEARRFLARRRRDRI